MTSAPLGHLDGLEQAANGDFLVSDWVSGKVYRVSGEGQATTILEGLKNSADIGLKGNVLLIPEMSASQVSAYEVK